MANDVRVRIAGQDDASAVLKRCEGTVESFKRASEALIGAEVIRKTAELVEHVTDLGASLDRMTQKTGLTVEQLSSLRYAATVAGSSQEELSAALNNFARQTLQYVETGAGKAAMAYKGLGIAVRDSNGQVRPMGDLLQEAARKISNLPPGLERSGTASQLFGRQGANLIPLLRELGEGWDGLTSSADQAGQLMSGKTAKELHEAEEQIVKVKAQVEGLGVQFVSGVVPAIMSFAQALAGGTSQMDTARRAGESLAGTLRQVAILGELARNQWNQENMSGQILGAKMDLKSMQMGAMFGPGGDPKQAQQRAQGIEAQKKHIKDLEDQQRQMWEEHGRNLAALRGDFNTPFTPTPAATEPGDGIDYAAIAKTKDLTKQLEDAKAKLAEAGAAERIAIARAEEKAQLAELQLQMDQGLIVIDDYYKRRAELQQKADDDELQAMIARENALIQKRDSFKKGTPEYIAADAEVTKAESDIWVRVVEIGEQEDKNRADELKGRQEIAQFIIAQEGEIRAAKGNTLQVAIEAIQREYDERRRQLAAKGGSQEDINGLNLVEQQKIALATAQNVQEEIDAVYAKLELDIERLNNRVATYAVSVMDAEKQLNKLRTDAADKISTLVDQYRALAVASGDPRMMADADKQAVKLDPLQRKTSQLRATVAGGLTQGFNSFFETLRNSGSAAQAFTNFVDSIVTDLARMYEQLLANYLIMKVMGLVGSAIGGGATLGGGPAADTTGISGDLTSVSGLDESTIPFFAGGGSLAANQPAIVGDAGPELWVPSTAGQVLPNSVLNGIGKTPNVQVTVVNQGTQKTAQATTPQWEEQLKAWHVQVHTDDAMNNGPLSRGMTGF